MRKLGMLVSLILLSINSHAQIKFEKDPFSKILEKAKKENKMIFLDAYASWCGPCKMMEKNIFSKKTVGDYYNTTFVNAKIDMEKGEGVSLAKKYNVKAYPTYLFINGDGQVVNRSVGYFEEAQFIKLGKDASDPNNSMEAMRKKFEQGEENSDFLMTLIRQNYINDYDFAKKVSEKYFSKLAPQNITKDNLGMLLFFIKSTEDVNYQYFVKHKEAIVKIFPEKNYAQFDQQIKLSGIVKKSLDTTTKTINDAYFLQEATKIVGKEEAEKSLNKIKLSYSLNEKNYDAYEKTALNYYKNASSFESNELNDVAWNFYLHVKNAESLKSAVLWAEESVKKSMTSHNTDTLAHLYDKIGDQEKALKWASISVEIAKKAGEDYADTQKLIDKIQNKK